MYEKFLNEESIENIENFNKEFKKVISGLEFYLKGWKCKDINDKIKAQFSELSDKYSNEKKGKIVPIHILNFNFTATVEQYINP